MLTLLRSLASRIRDEWDMALGHPTRTDYYWQAVAYNARRELDAQRAAATEWVHPYA